MASKDVQILGLPTGTAPVTWLLPDALELIPKAVTATFDGTSASGDFLPTLEIVSDSGHVVSRVPVGSAVTAGGSAEVTWAPFLESSVAAVPTSSAGLVTPFQPIPLSGLYNGAFDDSHPFNVWGAVTDAAAIDGLFSNTVDGTNGNARVPALNDYFTLPVTLGPRGSAWSIFGTWKLQPSGGRFLVTLGSVAETNGVLAAPSTVTYRNPLVLGGNNYFDDTYQAVTSYDGGSSVFSQSCVIGGADGAPFTAVTGTDLTTGYPIINGGAGTYRFKVQVTSKNAASTGYRLDLMALAWVRADVNGLI